MLISDWSSDVCSSDLPRLPERGRQIIMLARMMDDMARPEPAHAVGAAVKGIISEIVEEEAEDPRPPQAFEFDPDVEQAILIHTHRRPEEHTSELQSLMRHSYAVFCLNKKQLEILNTHSPYK